MGEPEAVRLGLGGTTRLLHAPDEGVVKYQTQRYGGEWRTQVNLSYREAQSIGAFLEEIRDAHDIEKWLVDIDD